MMISLRICVFASFLAGLTNAGGVAFYDPVPSLKLQVGMPSASWGPWELCPYGVGVSNYALYYKADQGASGIRLECEGSPLSATSTIEAGSERTQVATGTCASPGINGAKTLKYDDSNGIMEIQMYCSSDASTPMVTPRTSGYTDISDASPIESSPVFCSAGHRICGVRTQVSNAKGLEGVEFACCSTSSSTNGDYSSACDFVSGYCGWDSDSVTVQTDPPNTIKLFDLRTGPMQYAPHLSIPGPTAGVGGTAGFVYYFSAGTGDYTSRTGDVTPKYFNSTTYGGLTTRDPRFSFYFMANNAQLGQLSLCVVSGAGQIVQKQILFNPFVIDLENFNAFNTPSPNWISLNFPIYANNTEFSLRFVIEKLERYENGGAGSGNFGFDSFDYVSKNAGTCANPGCHANATCSNATQTLTGFTCQCNTGFDGTGLNETDGCVERRPCDNTTVCQQSVGGNTCQHIYPGNYSCTCGSPYYELNGDLSDCIDINECNTTDFCGNVSRTTCVNTIGNYTCACLSEYTEASGGVARNNLTCAIDGAWSAWSVPGDGGYNCSKTCGGGTYNATRTCDNPVPEVGGATCNGSTFNENATCNTQDCALSCPVYKNCSACGNFTDFQQDGPLNLTLLYFEGLSANDLTWALEQLAKWNHSIVDGIAAAAACNVASLNESISQLDTVSIKVNELSTATSNAKMSMRDILDCNADKEDKYNEWLWEIFDKLCEYNAFLPHIYDDMLIKKAVLEAERDRCINQGPLLKFIDVMYRKFS